MVFSKGGEAVGYDFVGRRGSRVLTAGWGGDFFVALAPDDLDAFLAPILERMASYESDG